MTKKKESSPWLHSVVDHSGILTKTTCDIRESWGGGSQRKFIPSVTLLGISGRFSNHLGDTVDGCKIHFAPSCYHGKPLVAGIYRGMIIPKISWVVQDFVHPQYEGILGWWINRGSKLEDFSPTTSDTVGESPPKKEGSPQKQPLHKGISPL